MRPALPGPALKRMAFAVVIGFTLHAAFDGYLIFGAARPNLSLTTLFVVALFASAETGAWLGFLAGLLEASYAAHFIGSYIVTRTLAGFLVGMLEERIFRDSVFVAVAVTFVGTLLVDTAFFAFAPQPQALRWFTGSVAQGALNALVAVPVYVLLRRFASRSRH